jgi:hypothetical protein
MVTSQPVTQWNSDSELGAGLHARDLILPKAEVFQIFDKDFVVASTRKGPVAVVRPASDGGERLALVGFDFLSDPLRYRVSSPILFANLMRWLAPQAFRTIQVAAEPVGLADVVLDSSEEAAEIHVTDETGRAVPFLVQGHALQFFIGAPRVVHVTTGRRERVLSMSLPQVATDNWKIPPSVPQAMPGVSPGTAMAMDFWPFLACLGGLGLIAEWLVFGGSRTVKFRSRDTRSKSPSVAPAKQREELVTK